MTSPESGATIGELDPPQHPPTMSSSPNTHTTHASPTHHDASKSPSNISPTAISEATVPAAGVVGRSSPSQPQMALASGLGLPSTTAPSFSRNMSSFLTNNQLQDMDDDDEEEEEEEEDYTNSALSGVFQAREIWDSSYSGTSRGASPRHMLEGHSGYPYPNIFNSWGADTSSPRTTVSPTLSASSYWNTFASPLTSSTPSSSLSTGMMRAPELSLDGPTMPRLGGSAPTFVGNQVASSTPLSTSPTGIHNSFADLLRPRDNVNWNPSDLINTISSASESIAATPLRSGSVDLTPRLPLAVDESSDEEDDQELMHVTGMQQLDFIDSFAPKGMAMPGNLNMDWDEDENDQPNASSIFQRTEQLATRFIRMGYPRFIVLRAIEACGDSPPEVASWLSHYSSGFHSPSVPAPGAPLSSSPSFHQNAFSRPMGSMHDRDEDMPHFPDHPLDGYRGGYMASPFEPAAFYPGEDGVMMGQDDFDFDYDGQIDLANIPEEEEGGGPPSAPICRYYLQGFCKNGARCTFYHPPKSALQNFSPEELAGTLSGNIICKFHVLGHCKKGSKCPYIHPDPSTIPPGLQAQFQHQAYPMPRSPKIGDFFSNIKFEKKHNKHGSNNSQHGNAAASSSSSNNSNATSPIHIATEPKVPDGEARVRRGSKTALPEVPPGELSLDEPATDETGDPEAADYEATKQEAERSFRLAMHHYHRCEFGRALQLFELSYERFPSKEAQAMISKTITFHRAEQERAEREAALEQRRKEEEERQREMREQRREIERERKLKEDEEKRREKEKRDRELKEKEERDKEREREEKERDKKLREKKEKEDKERKEREKKEREEREKKEREERERKKKERKEREERERKEREERERKEREEREKREKEEKERRDKEEQKERERKEKELREKREREEAEKKERERRELERLLREQEKEKEELERKQREEQETLAQRAELKRLAEAEAEHRRTTSVDDESAGVAGMPGGDVSEDEQRLHDEEADTPPAQRAELPELMSDDEVASPPREDLPALISDEEVEKAQLRRRKGTKHVKVAHEADEDDVLDEADEPIEHEEEEDAESGYDVSDEAASDDEDEDEDDEEEDTNQTWAQWLFGWSVQAPHASSSSVAEPASPTPEQTELVDKILAASSYYQILDLEPSATLEDVKQQYKRLAPRVMPSRNLAKGAEGAYQSAALAYSVLSDPVKRHDYDLFLGQKKTKKAKGTPTQGHTHHAAAAAAAVAAAANEASANLPPHRVRRVSRRSVPSWKSHSASSRMKGRWLVTRSVMYVLRLVLSVVALVVMGIVLGVQRMGSGVAGRYRSFKYRKHMKWCRNCADYHVVGGEDGTFWEEDGHYYFMKEGLRHDVSDLINNRAFLSHTQAHARTHAHPSYDMPYGGVYGSHPYPRGFPHAGNVVHMYAQPQHETYHRRSSRHMQESDSDSHDESSDDNKSAPVSVPVAPPKKPQVTEPPSLGPRETKKKNKARKGKGR
eukprot:TRINITY_DN1432_c0_g1_i2.p1 TRINITY_DN1432_c0_g1~~TRINITY_DN1432_c0_g1_i2.p1  ORF type:complete len:1480 (-),score=506.59 TRINITY_DN1432_c0_g1_i2:4-4443(-)